MVVCGGGEFVTANLDGVPALRGLSLHIACDGRSSSVIVLPMFGPGGELVAVFDVDSEHLGAFGSDDERDLISILDWFVGNDDA